MRAPRHPHLLLPVLLLLTSACGRGGSEYQPPADWVYAPPVRLNDGWESASLQSVGMDPAPLVSLMNTLRARTRHLVHGIVIVRHGKLVFEEYFPGLTHPTFGEEPVVFTRDTTHCLSSVAKSFTATLLGIAIEHGFIAGVDQRALELFPDLGDLNVGVWNGQRILPPEWIEASASAHSAFSERDPDYGGQGSVGYSYGWWVKSGDYGPGAYEAAGWGGQRIIVLPELDMVVALTGGAYWEPAFMPPHEIMLRYVLPSAM